LSSSYPYCSRYIVMGRRWFSGGTVRRLLGYFLELLSRSPSAVAGEFETSWGWTLFGDGHCCARGLSVSSGATVKPCHHLPAASACTLPELSKLWHPHNEPSSGSPSSIPPLRVTDRASALPGARYPDPVFQRVSPSEWATPAPISAHKWPISRHSRRLVVMRPALGQTRGSSGRALHRRRQRHPLGDLEGRSRPAPTGELMRWMRQWPIGWQARDTPTTAQS